MKALLKITTICAACAMLSAYSRAQSDSQTDQSSRSWSTKHLSATGRMSEPTVSGSKLMGAQVNDSSGNRCGQIQDIVVNPRSGRIEFAVLALNANPEGATATPSSSNVVPVPWAALRTTASSQYGTSAEQPVFTLNVDKSKLDNAPKISESDLNQSEWRQRVYAYYGVTPQSPMGGAESEQGEIKGEGARSLQQGNPEAPQPPPQPPLTK